MLLLKVHSFKLQFWGQILSTENIPGKACVSSTAAKHIPAGFDFTITLGNQNMKLKSKTKMRKEKRKLILKT